MHEVIGYLLLAVTTALAFGGFCAKRVWLRWVCVVAMFALTITQMWRSHNTVLAWVTSTVFVVGVLAALILVRRAAAKGEGGEP